MRMALKQKHVPLIATVAVWILLYLAASIRFPGMMSFTVLLNLFTDNSFLGICAIGMTFVLLSGGIDLSVGAVVGCSSIIIAVLVRDFQLHPGLAVCVVMGLGVLFGAAMGSLIHFFELPAFMVTLAGMFFARGMGFVISVNSIPVNHPFYNGLSDVLIPIGDGSLTMVALFFILITLAGMFLAHRTRFGRSAYAVGGNEVSARLMGLEIGRTKIGIYALSGFCASFAGAVYSLYTYSGNSWAGNGMEMDAIAAAVIGGTLLTGGVGYVFGTLIGVLILGVIQTYITFDGTLSSWWTKIAIGILLFVFIILQRFMSEASLLRKTKPAVIDKCPNRAA